MFFNAVGYNGASHGVRQHSRQEGRNRLWKKSKDCTFARVYNYVQPGGHSPAGGQLIERLPTGTVYVSVGLPVLPRPSNGIFFD